jgi:hypothetical protein
MLYVGGNIHPTRSKNCYLNELAAAMLPSKCAISARAAAYCAAVLRKFHQELELLGGFSVKPLGSVFGDVWRTCRLEKKERMFQQLPVITILCRVNNSNPR